MREEREVGKKRRFRRLLVGLAVELKLQGFSGYPLEPSVGISRGILREERKNRLLRVRLRSPIGPPDSLGII